MQMTAQGSQDRCHRCLQPLAPNTRRCPNCREFVHVNTTRRLSLTLAVVGMIVVAALVAIGLSLSPSLVDPENTPEVEQKSPPPKPAKKPPLN
jgi:uncharacterized paraquat-inducible protein A